MYSNSEAVGKKFLKKYFGSKTNCFVKCNPPNGGSTYYRPDLTYLGTDSTDYYDHYEIKSDAGWGELVTLCAGLDNGNNLDEIIDIDRAIWMLALDNVLVNLDSYIGAFAQNYYLYKDDNERFLPIIWDLNESFGKFAQTGSSSLNSTSDKAQMSHLLHESDSDYPLIQKILSNDTYKRMYLAHYKTILLENFDNEAYYSVGEALQTTIDASVQADNNKFYTYSEFLSNLDSDTGSSNTGGRPGPPSNMDSAPGIKSLMEARNNYLLAQSDFTQTTSSISNIELSEERPIVGENSYITATISNANNAFVGYRNKLSGIFEHISMYDDGAHDDGNANDGVYGAAIVVKGSTNQYYVYAENSNAGIFSPARAEHEFYSFDAQYGESDLSGVVINELMASNDNTASDQNGEYDDWIELYNNSDETISLTGYSLSDDPDDLQVWSFPAGTSIEANSYLIIWADNDTEQSGLHANFKLSTAGESILLSDATGLINEVSYLDLGTDESYGRLANGTGDFMTLEASFNTENLRTTGIESTQEQAVNIRIYPNPAASYFYLVNEDEVSEGDLLQVYSLQGGLLYQAEAEQAMYVPCADWSAGMYLVKYEGQCLKLVIE